jgi:uncharacterized membrane protein HdeD (DUF308 family)
MTGGLASPESDLSVPATLVRVLLGIVLTMAGVVILGDVALATRISAFIIGLFAIIGGAFQILHALWTKGWGGFIWHILLGALYIALGIVLVSQPVTGALILTYVLGLAMLLSGIVRVFLSFSHWREAGWVMLISGVFAALAGLVVLTGFPVTGLWVLGLLLGIDLISHGAAWLAYAFVPAARAG